MHWKILKDKIKWRHCRDGTAVKATACFYWEQGLDLSSENMLQRHISRTTILHIKKIYVSQLNERYLFFPCVEK